MAITLSTPQAWTSTAGSWKLGIAEIQINTYATGGVTLTPSDLGLTTVYAVFFDGCEDGYQFRFDYTNKKILVYAPIKVVHSGAPAAAQAVCVVAADNGFEATFGTTRDFPMLEVENSLDLSAVRVRILGIGV